jgi:hypothetical protein
MKMILEIIQRVHTHPKLINHMAAKLLQKIRVPKMMKMMTIIPIRLNLATTNVTPANANSTEQQVISNTKER